MTALASRWLVVQTQPMAAAKAERHIARQGGQVYAPIFYDGCPRCAPARLFPGYLFVRIFGTASWLQNTIGVLRVLCMGTRPCVVHPTLIDTYQALADADGVVVLPDQRDRFTASMPVRINGGPMQGQVGVVEGMDAQQRVSVLLSLLGRQSRVSCPAELLEPV